MLLPRLRTITEEVHGAPDGPAQFSKIVEQLKTNPSPDAPSTDAPNKITYDEMVLALLLQVYDDAKQKGVDKNDDRLREVLIANLKGHIVKLGEHQERLRKDLEKEEEEKAKKITSESMHEGFESHVSLSSEPLKYPKHQHSMFLLRRSPNLSRVQRRRPLSNRPLRYSTRKLWNKRKLPS